MNIEKLLNLDMDMGPPVKYLSAKNPSLTGKDLYFYQICNVCGIQTVLQDKS